MARKKTIASRRVKCSCRKASNNVLSSIVGWVREKAGMGSSCSCS